MRDLQTEALGVVSVYDSIILSLGGDRFSTNVCPVYSLRQRCNTWSGNKRRKQRGGKERETEGLPSIYVGEYPVEILKKLLQSRLLIIAVVLGPSAGFMSPKSSCVLFDPLGYFLILSSSILLFLKCLY